MPRRLLLAVPLAAFLLAAPSYAQSAKERASAARKAEKSKDWKKAAQEWMAAYQASNDPENLLNAGDAYAKAGDKANARKAYQQYMADPLSLDGNRAKTKLAALDSSGGGLDLDLGAPAAAAAPAADLGLDLGAAPAVAAESGKGRKSKKSKKSDDLGLDLGAAPAAPAATADLSLDLGAPVAAKAPEKKAPAGDLGLDLGVSVAKADTKADSKRKDTKPAADLGLDLGGPVVASAKPAEKKQPDLLDLGMPGAPAKGAVAANTGSKPAEKGVTVASNTPSKPAPTVTPPAQPKDKPTSVAIVTRPEASKAVPVVNKPAPPPEAFAATHVGDKDAVHSGSGQRAIAWVTAGAAVVALGAGGYYYTQASQDSTNLRAQVRSGAEQTALLEQQKQHKSLSFAGLAAGLVTAGVSAALFAF